MHSKSSCDCLRLVCPGLVFRWRSFAITSIHCVDSESLRIAVSRISSLLFVLLAHTDCVLNAFNSNFQMLISLCHVLVSGENHAVSRALELGFGDYFGPKAEEAALNWIHSMLALAPQVFELSKRQINAAFFRSIQVRSALHISRALFAPRFLTASSCCCFLFRRTQTSRSPFCFRRKSSTCRQSKPSTRIRMSLPDLRKQSNRPSRRASCKVAQFGL